MKKKSKKNDLDFCQNSMTRDMNEKVGKTGVAGNVQILALKLNVHVQYNVLRPIWPAPITYPTWKVRVTIY